MSNAMQYFAFYFIAGVAIMLSIISMLRWSLVAHVLKDV